MKQWPFLFAAIIAFNASAQYQKIDYRDNDPFVFCTQGQDIKKAPLRCWWPIPPYTGAFMMNPICKPPTYPYGKDWSQDDTKSLGQYLSVCPLAIKPGEWKGQGPAENSPTSH